MDRNQRRPPDVNEALSSMLWTPYERTPSESSSDDDERLNEKLKKSRCTFDYSFPIKNHNNNTTTSVNSNATTTTTTTQYVPSFRKNQRYDNFRFSYPYYGPVPIVQKCITELPSYESLYQNNATPKLTSITGVHLASGAGRLVHSFTDNFVVQSRPSSAGALCDPSSAAGLLGLTNSMSGFSNNFTDEEEYDDDDDYEDDEDFDESPTSTTNNNNNRPSSMALQSTAAVSRHFVELAPSATMAASMSSSSSISSLNTGRSGITAAASASVSSLGESSSSLSNRRYQWPADKNRIAGVQNDNSGDLILTENNNISEKRHEQLQQQQQQLFERHQQCHYQQRQKYQEIQQEQQQMVPKSHHHHHDLKQHHNYHEQHEQHQSQQEEHDLGLIVQTMQPNAQDEDRDVVASDELEDLPEEIATSATLSTTTPATTTPSPQKRPLFVSAEQQKYLCNNNGERLEDTKCVRSVQTDLMVLSSPGLVEANVAIENRAVVSSTSLSRTLVRKSVDLFADASLSNIESATRSNRDIVKFCASSGESVVSSNVVTDIPTTIRDQHHLPLILDVRNTLLAMRLNIPAAQPSIGDPLKGTSIANHGNNNGNTTCGAITTTSVFLPLNESLIASRIARTRNSSVSSVNAIVCTTTAEVNNSSFRGAIDSAPVSPTKPSLTIQVNQGVDNRTTEVRDSVEGFANQCAGISVVSCFSGSSVPNSSSINKNNNISVANVVTTATTTTTTTSENVPTTVTTNSVNITGSAIGRGECDSNEFSASSTTTTSPPTNTNGLHSTSTSCLLSEQQELAAADENHHHRPLTRTFTSTECQTDDLPLVDRNEIQAVIAQSQTEALISREQRRRERRERRAQGRVRHPHILPPMHLHPPPPPPPPLIRPSMLPDILHSHFPPPYTALQSLGNPPPPPPPPAPMLTPVISTVPIATATAVNDGRFTIPLPVIRRSPSERSGKGCCGQWFAGPPLRALIAVVALGGVACALGGAALGATGLAGPPTSHLTAALLMIGVGVILVTVSGAAWRMTAPGGPPCLGLGSTVDLARCGRRPCNSRGAPHGLLYPEFQHRPPPPSYQASMQEYRLRLLLLDRDRQSGVVRGGSPPPTYRSHAGSLLRAPLSTTRNGSGGPGSEYSLPPSYRSRNTNTLARAPTAGLSDESPHSSSNRNSTPSNNTIDRSTIGDGNVPQNTAATPSLLDQYHNTKIDTTSSVQVNFPPSSTSAPSTTTTKDSRVHTTIAIEAGANGAPGVTATATTTTTRPNEHQQQQQLHHQHNVSLINQSQNLNEKLNPRVTSSNNINFSNNGRINNSIPSISSSTSNSGSHSCTKMSSSPSKSIVTTTTTTNLSPSSFASLTAPSRMSAEQSGASGNGNRKEMVTIVTISASQEPEQVLSPSDMEILAHL